MTAAAPPIPSPILYSDAVREKGTTDRLERERKRRERRKRRKCPMEGRNDEDCAEEGEERVLE